MNYKETGFRTLYNQFCVYMLNDTLKKITHGFPGEDTANCVLGYGYIDSEAGMSVDIFALGVKNKKNQFRFFESPKDIRPIARIGSIENEEFYLLDDPEGGLAKRYAYELERVEFYKASEELENTRKLGFLDSVRHPHYPDDVLVYLQKDGLGVEACWARMVSTGDHCILGILLNEPDQDFGYHAGETISFHVEEGEGNKIFCYSDMNPAVKRTVEDLKDGTVLKNAISVFNQQRTTEHFIDILEILRDSLVWIPCNVKMSDADEDRIKRLIDEAAPNGETEALVGQELQVSEDVRMIPDILRKGDDLYFPVFTSCEDMGDYGDNFSKVQKHFLEAISLAMNNEKELVGIVVNAFSEPFVLEGSLFDMVVNLKSSLV